MNNFLAFLVITTACVAVGFAVGVRIRRKHWFDIGYECGYEHGYQHGVNNRRKWRDRPVQ